MGANLMQIDNDAEFSFFKSVYIAYASASSPQIRVFVNFKVEKIIYHDQFVMCNV